MAEKCLCTILVDIIRQWTGGGGGRGGGEWRVERAKRGK